MGKEIIRINHVNHLDNMRLADRTFYHGKYYMGGHAQTPLTQQERKDRRERNGRKNPK